MRIRRAKARIRSMVVKYPVHRRGLEFDSEVYLGWFPAMQTSQIHKKNS